MNICINCNQETPNPKFCCRSCAAKYNNVHFPKRKIERKCTKCDDLVFTTRHTLCKTHWDEYKERKHHDKTIGEYRNYKSVKGKHPSWIHAHIRSFARSWLKDLANSPCAHCGYDKHVELAHIKAVTDFDDNALLREVNHRDNVLPLCPNCHWEFDNLPRSSPQP